MGALVQGPKIKEGGDRGRGTSYEETVLHIYNLQDEYLCCRSGEGEIPQGHNSGSRTTQSYHRAQVT